MSTWLSIKDERECLAQGTGKGIQIAVLDSAIETDNSQVRGLTLRDDLAIVEDGFQILTVEGGGRDVFGHGTAVCDIIHRIVPEAEIGSFRVLGEHLRSRTVIIREGACQALDRGCHILNCSFGCGREEHVLQDKDWIDEAYAKGRHIVAACNNQDFTKREWPGHFPSVITVNFIQTANPEAICYRSGHLVEFGARGEDIEVAWLRGDVKRVTGSSFATPHVAGLLARLLSVCPDLPPLEAKALLRQLANPCPNGALR